MVLGRSGCDQQACVSGADLQGCDERSRDGLACHAAAHTFDPRVRCSSPWRRTRFRLGVLLHRGALALLLSSRCARGVLMIARGPPGSARHRRNSCLCRVTPSRSTTVLVVACGPVPVLEPRAAPHTCAPDARRRYLARLSGPSQPGPRARARSPDPQALITPRPAVGGLPACTPAGRLGGQRRWPGSSRRSLAISPPPTLGATAGASGRNCGRPAPARVKVRLLEQAQLAR